MLASRTPDHRGPGLSQGIKSVLKRIDTRGKALLHSGAPWEEGMLEIDFSTEGLSRAELRLIQDWINAWRARIIKANGVKPRA